MYVGMFPNNAEHRHHVLQIEIGLNTTFRLQIDGASYDYRAVIIAPNVPHQVDDHNEWQLMLHIDPASLAAKQLSKTYLKNRRFSEIDFSGLGTKDEAMGMAMVRFENGKIAERWNVAEA